METISIRKTSNDLTSFKGSFVYGKYSKFYVNINGIFFNDILLRYIYFIY